ncbi:MAG TPA: Crp/Fnr family transcriptional regulator [Fimbriimonadales bacterium]|nr:Crp/Fnr family transcriptional regulator [Fimbriimonadales bacterium]
MQTKSNLTKAKKLYSKLWNNFHILKKELLHASPQKIFEASHLSEILTPKEIALMSEQSYLASAERGEILWLAGMPADYVTLIVKGFVKLTKLSVSGQEVVVDILGPEHWVGLVTAVEGLGHPCHAVAGTRVWYLKIPTSAFMSVYTKNTKLKDSALRELGERLRRAHEMMARLSSGNLEERLAATLLILSSQYGENTPKGLKLKIRLPIKDLANIAGVSYENTEQILDIWKKRNILHIDHRNILIQNQEALGEIVAQISIPPSTETTLQ